MILDVAHASDETFDDLASLAEARGRPIVDSHTGARALVDIERNLDDARMARIARSGGATAKEKPPISRIVSPSRESENSAPSRQRIGTPQLWSWNQAGSSGSPVLNSSTRAVARGRRGAKS